MRKTPEQRAAAKRRREARKLKDGGSSSSRRSRDHDEEPSSLRDVSDKMKKFDLTDYSTERGWKNCQRQVLALLEELEVEVEGKPPVEITHAMVGDMASIRVHLEKALGHARGVRVCLLCPTNDLPLIRKHTRRD